MRKLAVKERRRYCKGRTPESALRLTEELVRKAPVIMRRAEFWIESRNLRCHGEGQGVYERSVVKNRSD